MTKKTEYLNIRVLPEIKKALKDLADQEHRSIANMVEIMVREKCEKAGIKLKQRKPKK